MKVAVTGLRGFPDIQGGIETHGQHLYPLLVELGVAVTVLGRKPYVGRAVQSYKGVRIIGLPCPRLASLETVVHTLLSILYCGIFFRPDIIHVHAVGPGLFVPLAKLFGLKVIFTHHGEDYRRQKWGWFASVLLRLGESWGARYADSVITISQGLQTLLKVKYNVCSSLIPNGVDVKPLLSDSGRLEQFGLKPFQYVLIVGRLVPEKRHDDLISAYALLKSTPRWSHIKLAIVGGADHQSVYVRQIIDQAKDVEGVVFAGFQNGENLSQLYRWAGTFCLPSSHEGLPIALLEAMSAGCPVVASNIAANLEVGLSADEYFCLGDRRSLASTIAASLSRHDNGYNVELNRSKVLGKYDWCVIANETLRIFTQVSGRHRDSF